MPGQKTQYSRAPFEKLKMFEVPKAPEWAVAPSKTTKVALIKKEGGVSVSPATPIDDPMMFVGCNKNSQFKIESEPKVARLHAGILVDEAGQWYVVGFSGTTELNGSPVVQLQPTEIKNDDELTFNGNGPYKFSATSEESKKRDHKSDENEGEIVPTKKEKKEVPERVRCCHLLVKHNRSRRPSSWKSPVITRSKEEAIEILKGFRERIEKGEVKFQDLARVESDCSSARNGGDLGFFGHKEMQQEFEDAAFALEIGEMSGIVSTQSGVHIILRIE